MAYASPRPAAFTAGVGQAVPSAAVAHLLGAETLHLEYPTQVVFDSVTLGVNDGDRIGIVGRNGDGKSQLLGLLTGAIAPDSGRVTRRSGVRVGLLDQADTLDGASTVGTSLVGDQADHEWAGEPADPRRRRRPGGRHRLGRTDLGRCPAANAAASSWRRC